ncbi:hypothetical protein [Pseudomonas sp. OB66]|uniref:hypothetical protein n=1 Tax=Pseudomonas sp. OB66 TaxID=3137730 RepID=UPI00311E461F
MRKIKFLRINLPDGLERSYQRMISSPFERDGQNGFEGVSYSENHIEVKFIEQTVTREQVTDPFGDTREIISTRYITIDLAIYSANETNILILRNPPRSVNTLIKKMSAIIGNGFYAALITINIEDLGYYLNDKYKDLGLSATKVLATNLILDSHSTANIELLSNSNALSELKIHFSSPDVRIERARFSLTDHGRKSQLEVRATGTVGITGSKSKFLEEIVVDFIRSHYH